MVAVAGSDRIVENRDSPESVHSPMPSAPRARNVGSAPTTTREAEMTAIDFIHAVEPGDVVKTGSRHVGDAGRTGEIVAVLGEEEHEHYLVRWEDGHESILYPGENITIRPSEIAVASAD
jgi:hypothetical protein